MKGRDEILEIIKEQLFSVRHVFYRALDRATFLDSGGKAAWPDALGYVSLEAWNAAFDEAVNYKREMRKGASQ